MLPEKIKINKRIRKMMNLNKRIRYNKEIVNENLYGIDSMIIRFPMDQIYFPQLSPLNKPEIRGTLINEYSDDVELDVLEDGILKHYRVDILGSSIKFQIRENHLKLGDVMEILVNAKLLKERYFEGIRYDTIKDLYYNLMELEIIFISYENFLNGECYDIDIKKDFYTENIHRYIDVISSKTNIKAFSQVYHHNRTIRKDKNFDNDLMFTGITFNKNRKNSSYSMPYVHFYWKIIDMQRKSNIDICSITGFPPENQIRCEVNIRNKSILNKLGVGNKVRDLMKLNDVDFANKLFYPMLQKVLAITTYQVSKGMKMRKKEKLLRYLIHKEFLKSNDKEIIKSKFRKIFIELDINKRGKSGQEFYSWWEKLINEFNNIDTIENSWRRDLITFYELCSGNLDETWRFISINSEMSKEEFQEQIRVAIHEEKLRNKSIENDDISIKKIAQKSIKNSKKNH